MTVGGLPAIVLTATSNQATFTVLANASLGFTTVTATNPGGQTGSITFQVCDLLVPASWAGMWEIIISCRDAATDKVVAVDAITEGICAHAAVGFAFFSDTKDWLIWVCGVGDKTLSRTIDQQIKLLQSCYTNKHLFPKHESIFACLASHDLYQKRFSHIDFLALAVSITGCSA